jgi:hypothetical protein
LRQRGTANLKERFVGAEIRVQPRSLRQQSHVPMRLPVIGTNTNGRESPRGTAATLCSAAIPIQKKRMAGITASFGGFAPYL